MRISVAALAAYTVGIKPHRLVTRRQDIFIHDLSQALNGLKIGSTQVYVSRGAGESWPLRFNCPPKVTRQTHQANKLFRYKPSAFGNLNEAAFCNLIKRRFIAQMINNLKPKPIWRNNNNTTTDLQINDSRTHRTG